MKQYRLSVDDNIRFLEDIHNNKYSSIFENPYLKQMKYLHDRFQLKIHMNMFFSYTPDSFSLSDMEDSYKSEFEQNADWLKFSFHSLNNEPDFPYLNADVKTVLNDYTLVTENLKRIMGEKAVSNFTTLHYVAATKQACIALHENGVKGMMGMFTADEKNIPQLSYYLTNDQIQIFKKRSRWTDSETGLIFVRNDIVINNFKRTELMGKLQKLIGQAPEYVELMVHEQYFYPDFIPYHRDFFDKLSDVAELMQKQGYESILLDDIL